MHIFSKSPLGIISHIPLTNMVWKLELVYVKDIVGVGIRYVSQAGTALSTICGMDCEIDDKKILPQIIKVGFPKKTLEDNIVRLQEAFKTLHNQADIKGARVEEIISTVSVLVHSFYNIEKAIRTGSSASGRLEEWEWAVSTEMYGWAWPQENEDDESN